MKVYKGDRLPDITSEGKLPYDKVNKFFNRAIIIFTLVIGIMIGFMYLLSKGVIM